MAATLTTTSTVASRAVLVMPRRLTAVRPTTATMARNRVANASPPTAYVATVSAIAAHEAVLPTTKPQPARNPHHGPSRSRP